MSTHYSPHDTYDASASASWVGGTGAASGFQDPGRAVLADEGASVLSTVEFKITGFKVLPCAKEYRHAWATCPFAHKGEKAKRRDVKVYQYAGVACPYMKKGGSCPRGDLCTYAHNDFEYWLHPQRYRTELCRDGARCKRKVCFFAHRKEELRTSTPLAISFSTVSSPNDVQTAAAAAAAGTSAGGVLSDDSTDPPGLLPLGGKGDAGIGASLGGSLGEASRIAQRFSQLRVSVAGPTLVEVPSVMVASSSSLTPVTAVTAAAGESADGTRQGEGVAAMTLDTSAAGPAASAGATTAAAAAAGAELKAAAGGTAAGAAGGSPADSSGKQQQLLVTGQGTAVPVVSVIGSEDHVVYLNPANAALWHKLQQQQQANARSYKGSPLQLRQSRAHQQQQQVAAGFFRDAPLRPLPQQQQRVGAAMPKGSPLLQQRRQQHFGDIQSPLLRDQQLWASIGWCAGLPVAGEQQQQQLVPATPQRAFGARFPASATSYLAQLPLLEAPPSLGYLLPQESVEHGPQQQQQGLHQTVQVQLQQIQQPSTFVLLQPQEQQQQGHDVHHPLQLQLQQSSPMVLLQPQGGLYEQQQQAVYISYPSPHAPGLQQQHQEGGAQQIVHGPRLQQVPLQPQHFAPQPQQVLEVPQLPVFGHRPSQVHQQGHAVSVSLPVTQYQIAQLQEAQNLGVFSRPQDFFLPQQ